LAGGYSRILLIKKGEQMANKPIAMSKLKTLIRLYIESASKSKITRSTGLSRNTVKSYLQKVETLSWLKKTS